MTDDLISRQAAIYLANIFSSPTNIAKALVMLPSAQPEITHCRDCKWHNGEINQCNAQICASMYGEDFCSKGERREG